MNEEMRRIAKDLDLGDRELLPTIRFGEKFVYRFVVCGSSCLAVYSAMKEIGSLCGYQPVLVDEDRFSMSLDPYGERYLTLRYSVDKVMEESFLVDCEQWLDARRSDEVSGFDPASGRRSSYRHSNDVFIELTDEEGRSLDRVSVVLFPGEAVAFWGERFMVDSTWTLAVHVAILRRWRELWGAEIVTWGYDMVEMRCSKRPSTFEEALRLAWEHYSYTSDIFYERFPQHHHPQFKSLEDLAALLLRSDVWWFFWD